MTDPLTPSAHDDRPWWRTKFGIGLALVVTLAVGYPVISSLTPESRAVDACKSEARSRFGGDTRSVSYSFVDERDGGWFVKGSVEETVGGKASTVRHWECTDGRITWDSLVG